MDTNRRISSSLFTRLSNENLITFPLVTIVIYLKIVLYYCRILGLYAAYLLVAHRLLRSLYDGMAYNIFFNEMPYVDRIFRICQDIYLVRESRLFAVEENIVARLFFMFRSHETLIKWTRLPRRTVMKFSQPPQCWNIVDEEKKNV
jgi:hypothetical protein